MTGMRVGMLAGVVGVVLLGFVLLVGVGQRGTEQAEAQQEQAAEPSQVVDSEEEQYFIEDLIGTTVYSVEGVELGQVEDVVFDEDREEVAYVVMSRGGFIGIGDELYAIPWGLIELRLQADAVLAGISEELLEEREPLGDRWPTVETDAAARDWLALVEREQDGRGNGFVDGEGEVYGAGEYDLRRASELIGLEVQIDRLYGENRERWEDEPEYGDLVNGVYYDPEDNDPATDGEIVDLAINAEGRLGWAVIAPDSPFWDNVMDYQVVVLPWTQMTVMPEQEVVLAHVAAGEAMQLVLGEEEVHDVDYPYFWTSYFADAYVRDEYDRRIEGVGSPYTGYHNGYGEEAEEVRRRGDWVDEHEESANGYEQRIQLERERRRDGLVALRQWEEFLKVCLGPERRLDSTMTGTIRNVGTLYTRARGEGVTPPSGLRYMLDTEKNGRIRVYLGPAGEKAPFRFHRGDIITVRGQVCTIGGRRVLVPGYIEGENRAYQLVQEEGETKWVREGE